MKVMQINCVYNTGSTGKIMYDIHSELINNGIESVMCYGRGAKTQEKNVYKTSSEFSAKFYNVISRFTGMPYSGSIPETVRLINIIKKEKPDVVHIHCINGFFVNIYKLITFLKKHRIPTVLTHHAEFMYTGNCGYAFDCNKWERGCGECPSLKQATGSVFFDCTKSNFNKMRKAFDGFENLYSVAVSPWVKARVEKSPVFADKSNVVILNGIDNEVFKPYDDTNDLRVQLKIGKDKKVIIHVTAGFNNKIKGGNFIIDLAERIRRDAVILIIGNKALLQNVPENVIALGRIEDRVELARYYSLADLSVITSSRETFSMPVVESLCCGTPVVGFKAGGPESIALAEYSEFVEFGSVDKLYECVINWLDKKDSLSKMPADARAYYGKRKMAQAYIELYKKFFDKEE